ncbi:hypothetical protein D3C76_1111380 [compost metagenome]
MIGAQTTKAGFAGGYPFLSARVPRVDLRDQKDIFAPSFYRLADHFLCFAIGIHFGSIDQRQTQIDARSQCSHFALPLTGVFTHISGALPNRRQRDTVGKSHCFFIHASLLVSLHHSNANGAQAPRCNAQNAQ